MCRGSVALVLIWIVSASMPAGAAERPFRLVFEGGLTISKLRNVDDPNSVFESIKSPAAGAALSWRIAGPFEAEPHLDYLVKGISYGKVEATDNAGSPLGEFEALNETDVLEIPVLLRWNVPIQGRVHPSLALGPFASFELAERFKTTGAVEGSKSVSILKNTDYGVAFGAGIGVDMGPARWLLEGRYDLGLADIGPFLGSEPVHSGAFSLLAGVSF